MPDDVSDEPKHVVDWCQYNEVFGLHTSSAFQRYKQTKFEPVPQV